MYKYLLAPLDKHFDLGFGFMGNTFRDAATTLTERKKQIYHGDIPISYLQRHAIELYLKSAIIILHKIKGNVIDANNKKTFPKLVSSGKLKPIYLVHSVGDLHHHLRITLNEMEGTLKEYSEICWEFSDTLTSNISIIDKNDPSSTFFRYPVTNEKGDDVKSPAKESSQVDILDKMKSNTDFVKAIMVFDGNDDVISTYEIKKSMDEKISEALLQVMEELHGFHSAMRAEITDGW